MGDDFSLWRMCWPYYSHRNADTTRIVIEKAARQMRLFQSNNYLFLAFAKEVMN